LAALTVTHRDPVTTQKEFRFCVPATAQTQLANLVGCEVAARRLRTRRGTSHSNLGRVRMRGSLNDRAYHLRPCIEGGKPFVRVLVLATVDIERLK
jgi:hypothetical protein